MLPETALQIGFSVKASQYSSLDCRPICAPGQLPDRSENRFAMLDLVSRIQRTAHRVDIQQVIRECRSDDFRKEQPCVAPDRQVIHRSDEERRVEGGLPGKLD